jgi:hypothetical protein
MVVQTNDLCCKTGCICFLFSFYWKIPDCIGCDTFSSFLCWEHTCRTGFPTSICTSMCQCCCFDLRCAFPCDPSNVPMTIGVLGLICCDFQRYAMRTATNYHSNYLNSSVSSISYYNQRRLREIWGYQLL